MAADNFTKIEEGLGKLLDGYEHLKTENVLLKSALLSKDAEITELKEKVKTLEREKALVKEKVDMLINRLDSLMQGA
jgi:predicted nuclease with TOPRIM domain